jgi:Predicted hydrolases or acyltransferases (alpha/beta hydrolase superfamily)
MQFPELQYAFPYRTVFLSGSQSITYTDEGNGQDILLFIHGLASYIPAWRKNVAVLNKTYRCICIDLPGYGKSTAGEHSGKISFYAEVLAEFILTMKLHNVTLVGHSMGGHIAIGLTLLHPELVHNLILLAPAGFETFTRGELLLLKKAFTTDTFIAADEIQIRASFNGNFFRMPADTEPMIQDRLAMRNWRNFHAHAKVVANSLNGMLDDPVVNRLSLINQKTLVIYGENDTLIPHPVLHNKMTTAAIAHSGVAQLHNATLFFIKECGHFLQFEKPDEINLFIRAFIT